MGKQVTGVEADDPALGLHGEEAAEALHRYSLLQAISRKNGAIKGSKHRIAGGAVSNGAGLAERCTCVKIGTVNKPASNINTLTFAQPLAKRVAHRAAQLVPWAFGVVLAMAFVGCGEVSAMRKVILFSPLSGVVLSQGKPVAGATIKRHAHWRWGNKTYDDTATTDAQGRFSFAVLNGTMLLGSVLPHEPYIEQSITIEQGGQS